STVSGGTRAGSISPRFMVSPVSSTPIILGYLATLESIRQLDERAEDRRLGQLTASAGDLTLPTMGDQQGLIVRVRLADRLWKLVHEERAAEKAAQSSAPSGSCRTGP
ncbi:MAG: hypothetical protein WAV02_20665, partial [Stellaceae bacterium]